MGKRTLWLLGTILALAAAGYFALQGGPAAVKSPPQPAPTAPAAAPAAGERLAAPAPQDQPRTGRMELADAPRPFTPAAPAGQFSYSLKKENNERVILPGVTYSSAEGVSIKTAARNETIQIRRDPGNQAGDYQVMWQKKY